MEEEIYEADEMTGTSKGRDSNLRGLRQAIGKTDDAFKYLFIFFAKMSSDDCAVKVKREIEDVLSPYQTLLSEKSCPPPNQCLIYSSFVRRINKRAAFTAYFY